ncbi:Multidrug resistance protein 1 [Clydaea vesicula]|uniref:Multidrug resistance protein 1 n=1 Tax=Clydaea vesicula TaxID=447962 RepID=A0AAD5U7L0_9FUNG|nr:Multidrug resistance protein 1 [Clydaea vesicula]
MDVESGSKLKKSTNKQLLPFIFLSAVAHLFFFCISVVGIKNNDVTFFDLVKKSFSSLFEPEKTLLDLPIFSVASSVLTFFAASYVQKFHHNPVHLNFGKFLIILFATLNFLYLIYKLYCIKSYGLQQFFVYSFFVYSMIFVSGMLSGLQFFAACFKLNDWIKNLDYVDVPTSPVNDTPEIETEVKSKHKISYKRLFLLLKPDWKVIIIGMIALFVNSATQLAIPYYFGEVVDSVSKSDENTTAEHLTNVVSTLFLVFIIGGVSGYIRSYAFTLSGYCIVKRLRCDVFRAIILQDVEFFDETKTGDLLSRLSSDTQAMQSGLTVNISVLLRNLTQAVPLVVIIAVLYGNYVSDLQELFQNKLADSSSLEVISQIRTVRSFAKEQYSLTQYTKEIAKIQRIAKLSAIFMGAVGFFPQAALALVLYYGGILVMRNEITGGLLTSFLMYTLSLAICFGALSSLWGDFMQCIGSSQRIFELIDDKIPKIGTSGGITLTNFKGKISFKNVSFVYPTRKDAPVLKGLNLDLEPGKILALVGPSGQGKSTVMSLILRFYDPVEGDILLDDRLNLRNTDLEWYRGEIGLVSQEPVLFSGTIRENIAYGWNRKDRLPLDEEIFEAAKKANAHEFVQAFPEGYNTIVGERGVRLSGGQKQRLAISRAFLLNPKILLLDEATSALDAESEHLVQEAIDRAMIGRTVVVIAHRLSTVVNADKIALIENGVVVESGKHKELMGRDENGKYKKLVNRQMQGI